MEKKEMKNILAISSSSSEPSVAILKNDILKEKTFPQSRHFICENLIAGIKEILSENDLNRSQINSIFVDRGPGSFTGLRIGISTANALGLALNIPVTGFSSLDMIAAHIQDEKKIKGSYYCAISAGRNQFYYAGYEGKGNSFVKKQNDAIIKHQELLHLSAKEIFFGAGFQEINAKEYEIFPKAKYLLKLNGMNKSSLRQTSFASPNYVRLSDASINLKAKAKA